MGRDNIKPIVVKSVRFWPNLFQVYLTNKKEYGIMKKKSKLHKPRVIIKFDTSTKVHPSKKGKGSFKRRKDFESGREER